MSISLSALLFLLFHYGITVLSWSPGAPFSPTPVISILSQCFFVKNLSLSSGVCSLILPQFSPMNPYFSYIRTNFTPVAPPSARHVIEIKNSCSLPPSFLGPLSAKKKNLQQIGISLFLLPAARIVPAASEVDPP